jgi:hypothetical protein
MHSLNSLKSAPNCGLFLIIFKAIAQSCQSFIGRKIAQSGHPAFFPDCFSLQCDLPLEARVVTVMGGKKKRLFALSHTSASSWHRQGCQMLYFQTKNPNLGNFCSILEYIEDVGLLYGHLVYLTAIR